MQKNPSVKAGDLIELKVESVTFGEGRGVGRLDGLVFFVEGAVPGDYIKAFVTKVKKNYGEATINNIITPSADRIEAPCPIFHSCGGCSLQMMTYQRQLREKQKILERAFTKQGPRFEGIEPSPLEYRYRNRIQVQQKGKKLFYFKPKSHDLTEVKDCLIADRKIVDSFSKAKSENKNRRIEIALSPSGKILFREGKAHHEESLFSQVNTAMNEVLKSYVLEEARRELSGEGLIWDLYCGEGNFSFLFAESFPDHRVIGVELSKKSIERAKKKNKFKNLNFKASDVARAIENFKEEPELILLDPPRKGLSKDVVKKIVTKNAKTVFYISCNPSTASRDLSFLEERYNLVQVKGFDMFPQTAHIEVFMKLSLRG